MTYLETINQVMLRMRESAVTSWDQSDYSRLIGRLVNDAKREVENLHQWSGLKTLIDANVVANDTEVTFTGTNKRTRVIQVYNDTEDCMMFKRDRNTIIRWREQENPSQSARPDWWAMQGHDDDGNVILELWPDSDGSYTLTLDAIVPQDDISTNNTEITIPTDAIYLRATALALAERGDDQGQAFQQLMREYQIALNDAVQQDLDNAHIDDSWVTV